MAVAKKLAAKPKRKSMAGKRVSAAKRPASTKVKPKSGRQSATRVSRKPKQKRVVKVQPYKLPDGTPVQSPDGLTECQAQAFSAIASGANVFVAGIGGAGKSYLIEQVVFAAESCGREALVCAPTGIAALNVGGCTIHRALGIKAGDTAKLRPRYVLDDDSPLVKCDLVIVDEVSMCRMDLFDHLSRVLGKVNDVRAQSGQPPVQLVVVGDFHQLPPVLTRDERAILAKRYDRDVRGAYAFMGREWASWRFVRIDMDEAVRQGDSTFVLALNSLRRGEVAGLRWCMEHAADERQPGAVVLCGRNADADRENEVEMRLLDGEPTVYKAFVKGRVDPSDMPCPRALALKVGARVMATTNDKPDTYMNGSVGVVVGLSEDAVRVDFGGSIAEVKRRRWDISKPVISNGSVMMSSMGSFTQIPLKPAWAMTIHKSQGQTFDAVDVYPDCWDAGQLYVAVSRVRDVRGLHFAHEPDVKACIASSDVLAFDALGDEYCRWLNRK